MIQQIDLSCIQQDKLETDLSSPDLKSFKQTSPISDDYEDATSPCLLKKRRVQKGSNSREQIITELRITSESDVESNPINKDIKNSGSPSIHFGNLSELNIFQNKSPDLSQMGFRKAKKSPQQGKSVEEGQAELTYTSLKDQINITNNQTDQLRDLSSKNGMNLEEDQLLQQNTQKLKTSQDIQEQDHDIERVQKQTKYYQNQENQEQKYLPSLREHQDIQQEIEEEEDEIENQQSSDNLEISQQDKTLKQIVTNKDNNGGNKKTRNCNCKKTKCLKLYCDCFAAGEFCGGECNCCDCSNTLANKEARNKVIEGILEKNPFTYNVVKDIETEDLSQLSVKTQKKLASKKGCNCRRSGCLKKYCQCYQEGLQCGEHCKCDGCENCDKPKNLLFGEQNSIQAQSKKLIQNESLKINTQSHILQQNYIKNQELSNSSKQISNNLSINSMQKKHSNQGSFLQNNMNILQQQIQDKKNQIRKENYNNQSINNKPFNFMNENAQQLMLTQLLSNMVNQQTQILNNPLIQLAAMQASLQKMLIEQQQQQFQYQQQQKIQNNIENKNASIQNILLSAATTATNNINQLFNYLL